MLDQGQHEREREVLGAIARQDIFDIPLLLRMKYLRSNTSAAEFSVQNACNVPEITVGHRNITYTYYDHVLQMMSCQTNLERNNFWMCLLFPMVQKHQLQLHEQLLRELCLLPGYNDKYVKNVFPFQLFT